LTGLQVEQYGFWTVDGSTDFGIMPAGIIPGVSGPVPIKFQSGNRKWGAMHIQERHGTWLQKYTHTPASMVHAKLAQSGSVFTTEEADKTKVSLTLSPSALLILRYIPQFQFLTVVSVYAKAGKLDGTYLGRYKGPPGPVAALRPVPVFAPPATHAATQQEKKA
jgi:hypothetical protein